LIVLILSIHHSIVYLLYSISVLQLNWFDLIWFEIHKLYEIHIGKAANKPTGNCYSIDITYIQ